MILQRPAWRFKHNTAIVQDMCQHLYLRQFWGNPLWLAADCKPERRPWYYATREKNGYKLESGEIENQEGGSDYLVLSWLHIKWLQTWHHTLRGMVRSRSAGQVGRDTGKHWGCSDWERDSPGVSTTVYRHKMGHLVKDKSDLFREAPERRSRRDGWNSREMDFSLMKGRHLEQLELSFPTMDWLPWSQWI